MSGVELNRFEIWMANLNPQRGTEVGKVRPVLVIQTDLLKGLIPSTIMCPITSKPTISEITKVRVEPDVMSGLKLESWIIIDQMRSVDNRRFVEKLGELHVDRYSTVNRSIKIILGLE